MKAVRRLINQNVTCNVYLCYKGAHLCGHGGAASAIKFDRITGLDPANQFFENMDEAVRLDKRDAKYVDAIHTSTGILLSGSFGIIQPVG